MLSDYGTYPATETVPLAYAQTMQGDGIKHVGQQSRQPAIRAVLDAAAEKRADLQSRLDAVTAENARLHEQLDSLSNAYAQEVSDHVRDAMTGDHLRAALERIRWLYLYSNRGPSIASDMYDTAHEALDPTLPQTLAPDDALEPGAGSMDDTPTAFWAWVAWACCPRCQTTIAVNFCDGEPLLACYNHDEPWYGHAHIPKGPELVSGTEVSTVTIEAGRAS